MSQTTPISILPPGPLPPSEWLNRPGVKHNYTELYELHAPAILCFNSFIPVGVLGFYYWLALQIITVLCNYLEASQFPRVSAIWPKPPPDPNDISRRTQSQKKESEGETETTSVSRRKTLLLLISSSISLAYSIFIIVQHFRVVIGCRTFKLWIPYAGLVLGISIVVCLANLTSFAAITFKASSPIRHFLLATKGSILCIALLIQLMVGVPLLFDLGANLAGRTSQRRSSLDYLDPISLNATLVTSIASFALGAFALAMMIWLIVQLKLRNPDRLARFSYSWFVIDTLFRIFFCVVFALLFSLVGSYYVLMGKIIGDPWGKIFLKSLAGKAAVSILVVFPGLQGIILVILRCCSVV